MAKPFYSISEKPTYRLTLVICLTLMFNVQIANAGNSIQPAMSATLEHRFDPTQQVLSRSNVTISADGYRIESLPLQQGQVLIANTSSGKTWFVDIDRAFVHEVPYRDVEGVPELDELFISLPGFIDSVPCNITGGSRIADVQFKGRLLERWQCDYNIIEDAENTELPAEQYFSNEFNMVLFSRSHNKLVSELTNIKDSLVDKKLFTVPKGLRSVTLEEFLGEYQVLEEYME